MITVRRATVADTLVVYDLQCRLWPDDNSNEDGVAALLARDDFSVFLAERDGVALGLAEATLQHYVDGAPDGLSGFLQGIFVTGYDRRAGISKLLLVAVEDWLRACGVGYLGSDSDLDNSPGAAWHEATGFIEVGRTINYAKRL
ncbi:GNAT family N-acetyltransferase [Glacieibacterium megasporae]|uniref:GNAT family N-acetyltransferase n=1 Tax=Glacieibacterium megasporae TaxID=2835787 RepID=UPI001C1E2240|nr:GNAT family N-acetyltransferase [Polymorphobacter megasporae]UAJ10428.1 GNAT family N-acetyltransferase [Polymorphobacter megasporae]